MGVIECPSVANNIIRYGFSIRMKAIWHYVIEIISYPGKEIQVTLFPFSFPSIDVFTFSKRQFNLLLEFEMLAILESERKVVSVQQTQELAY
eukprot:bmy_07062T0